MRGIMTFSAQELFIELFQGNTQAYGKFIPDGEQREDGKITGKASTVTRLLTESEYRKHLDGKEGLGVCPLRQDGTCSFTVIDIDVYSTNVTKHYLQIIKKYDFPLFAFRSKSGGLHLYTFYDAPLQAKDAVNNAQAMRKLLGLPSTTEVFPKQTTLGAGGKGNWINLPYFAGDDGTRKLLHEDGTEYDDIEYALETCKTGKINSAMFQEWQKSLPLNDAPPCLQTIYLQGTTEGRNNYMFAMTSYLKAKFKDAFEPYVYEINDELEIPLSHEELEKTVLNSHRKNTYPYRCKEMPICAYCDKQECKKRPFAVGDSLSALSFEKLIMYKADPPYYDWLVNGTALRFNSEQEIIQQHKFRALCLRLLGVLPNKVKDEVWTDVINNSLSDMEIRIPEQSVNTNDEFLFAIIMDFILSVDFYATPQDAYIERKPFLNRDKNAIYVDTTSVCTELVNKYGGKVNIDNIREQLSKFESEPCVVKVFGRSIRFQKIPLVSLIPDAEDRKAWVAGKQIGYEKTSLVAHSDLAEKFLNSVKESDI